MEKNNKTFAPYNDVLDSARHFRDDYSAHDCDNYDYYGNDPFVNYSTVAEDWRIFGD